MDISWGFHLEKVRKLLFTGTFKKVNHHNMPQVSVVVPDDIQELLTEVAKETGRSISSLCADYIEEGVYKHVEQLNKVEIWRSQIAKRKTRQKPEGEE